MRRIVVAITGASGSIYGVRLLDVLAAHGAETHVILASGAETTIAHELGLSAAQVESRAHARHDDRDLASRLASGSFRVDGMVVAPCSIKTLSGIANSYDENLVVRAADVRLKERQPLVLVVRETPLHIGHLKLMTAAAEAGAVILPPVPSMYIRPQSIDDLVDHTVMRICDQLGVATDISMRWQGLG